MDKNVSSENKSLSTVVKIIIGTIITAFILPLIVNIITPYFLLKIDDSSNEAKKDYGNTRIVDTYIRSENFNGDQNLYYKYIDASVTLAQDEGRGVISRSYLFIDSIERLKYYEIQLFGFLNKNALSIGAINNGFGDYDLCQSIDFKFIRHMVYNNNSDEFITYSYNDFLNGQNSASIDCLNGGEVKSVYKIELNNKLLSCVPVLEENIYGEIDFNRPYLEVVCYLNDNETTNEYKIGALVFDKNKELHFVSVGGGGADEKSIKYVTIKVDSANKKEIDLGNINDVTTSRIIDTYVIPDLPCTVSFSFNFMVNGKLVTSSLQSCNVYVPLYNTYWVQQVFTENDIASFNYGDFKREYPNLYYSTNQTIASLSHG